MKDDRRATDLIVMMPPLDSSRKMTRSDLKTTNFSFRSKMLSDNQSNVEKYEARRSHAAAKQSINQVSPVANLKRVNMIHKNLHIISKLPKQDDLMPLESKGSLRALEGLKEISEQKNQLNKPVLQLIPEMLPILRMDDIKFGQAIGQGRSGLIRKAYCHKSGRLLAVKSFHSARDQLHEVNILRCLRHKNIVRLQGTTQGLQSTYLIMQHLQGGSLKEIIKEFGCFEQKLVRKYVRQLLDALCYLHKYKIIYNGLKCSNILSDTHGLIKLGDFHDARDHGAGDSVNGDFHWKPPETLILKEHDSLKSDVWSLGCTIVEMLTGSHPWKQYMNASSLASILEEERCPKIPDNLSSECKDFLVNCFVWDPKERPSMEELRKMRFVTPL